MEVNKKGELIFGVCLYTVALLAAVTGLTLNTQSHSHDDTWAFILVIILCVFGIITEFRGSRR